MTTKQLLLIDDNEDNRILVKFALEMNSEWQVSLASCGLDGIIQAEMERPDVILLDFAMPDLDGLTVYEILKNNLFTCSIPIIFITAMTQKKLLAELENTLASGIIIKPFDINSLDLLITEMSEGKINAQIVKHC